jgi:carbonic anhydrase
MFRLLLSVAALTDVTACPQHETSHQSNIFNKRAGGIQDWTYEASYNWGMINPSISPVVFPFHLATNL